ncbi:MAG: hypothetical protein HYY04_19115, partial [Chloroflexi bacterium]|nr:hypothetical protein [Chloroflexota bacterium]
PPTHRRPLQRFADHAYAVTRIAVRLSQHLPTDPRTSHRLHHQSPVVTYATRLYVIRDDGLIFGPEADRPLEDLGLELALGDTDLPGDRLWRKAGVAAYRAGRRPDPAHVFRRVAAIYDHYLDFSRSLASQSAMCDLSACLSLMTWFSDAFDVLPYPWANGDFGSGKTKWGTLWALSSYLGHVLTWGATFAALRDLADWGAALLFDDAENVDDPRTSDPDKRALLLAGNRRGAQVPLKVSVPDGRTWRIRWVNAYCPRAFSARAQPHGPLETRALVIPLIRTGDSAKGNRDPADTERWPCDRPELQDDLWATGLSLLGEAHALWRELDHETQLVGRAFEPWRAPLAVARLFARHGVAGLEETIRQIMSSYADAKPRTIAESRPLAVLRALLALARLRDISVISDVSDINTYTSTEIANAVTRLLHLTESDASWVSPWRIGRIMSDLRFPMADRSSKRRGWVVPYPDLLVTAAAYGLRIRNTSPPSPSAPEEGSLT